MYRLFLCYFLSFYGLTAGSTLSNCSYGTNFTHWSEDDWIETRFLINTKFMFHRQRYDHLTLCTRMNEWSLELSVGNRSNSNQLWTELHLFLDRRSSLNHSLSGHIRHQCNPPIFSPLTNDSNTQIPQLTVMDERIASYFISDGFFRTINYIHCRIDERRWNPDIHIHLDIYLVTNREFQSLLYIEMSNETRKVFVERQARFYLHNYERQFKYNLNVSTMNNPINLNTAFVHMIKLYDEIVQKPNHSVRMLSLSNVLVVFSGIIFLFIK